jgi:hypothetical protein
MKSIVLLALISGIACGQPRSARSLPPAEGVIPGGSIGGKDISDWTFYSTPQMAKQYLAKKESKPLESITEAEVKAGEIRMVCEKLHNQIYRSAKEQAIRDLGVSATGSEFEAFSKQLPSITDKSTLWNLATEQKLHVTIDQRLAANDQLFKKYQPAGHDNFAAPPRKYTGPGVPVGWDYLQDKRYDWWAAQEAKVSVLLNDPTLASRCGFIR